MPSISEGRYTGEFIVSEANGLRSREDVPLSQSITLQPGEVLGKITATGKHQALNPVAVDGTEAAAGISYDHNAPGAVDTDAVAIVRDAEVNAAELVWPAGITGPQQATAIAELAALGIIVR